ncbi:hypothetical protein HHL22_07665 [Hymenobacter sp. RP-2-7]|uniref:Lipocalin-like domain-containing protein n=1 Tax=Hymenobacter polaris TaxID=2682546 RepID=A0A7Y0ACZ5_9BACT|nr:hypothetical protein [Hymenobacter polaris]NML65081.1 hypothetical protein [Hymenobacter polaris]
MKPVFAFLLAGCLADHHPTNEPAPSSLVGTWRLIEDSALALPKKPSNIILVLDNKGQFRFFLKKHLEAHGTYFINRSSTCNSKFADRDFLILNSIANIYAPDGIYKLRGDTLIIDSTKDGCAFDASIRTYLRVP